MGRGKAVLLAVVNWTIHRLLDWQKAMVRVEAARLGAGDPFAECCPEETGPLSRITLPCSDCKGTGESSHGWDDVPPCHRCNGRGTVDITLDRRTTDANL